MFVSDTPRRAVVVRWIGRVGALLAVAYIVITAGGMVGASWVPRLSLPGVGPVALEQHPGATPSLGTTAERLATPDLSRANTGSRPAATTSSTVVSRTSGDTGATTTRTNSTASTTQPTNPAGNTPGNGNGRTTTSQPSSTGTTRPGRSGSAPGHTTTTLHHGH